VSEVWFGAGLLVLTALTLTIQRWSGVGLGWFPLWALLRAVVQLSIIALILRGSRSRRDEIEAWLSLGAPPVTAHRDIGQEAVRESLLPSLDQTKSTGLVTLPGAFVGALFGGASPVEAAKFQLVVLAGIALAMTITAVVVTRLAGRTPYLPVVEKARKG
jgi:ABC-type iron transport system FetAB permease component